mgnify:CR=1 FL=1|jgi:hypothetical protein
MANNSFYKIAFKDNTSSAISNIEYSGMSEVAFFEILDYELSDKTFLLLILFCFLW